MELDFPTVLEELAKVKDTGFSQYGFIEALYSFIGECNVKYKIEIKNIEVHASDVKRRIIHVNKKAKEGAFDKRVIADMPAHVQTRLIPNLKVEKCEALVERLLAIIDSDEEIGVLAKERMLLAAKDRSKLHIFLAEVILYSLQHSRDKKGNSPKEQSSINQETSNIIEGLVSNLILPVSGANYISRPKAEEDILDSLQHHKVTIIRALSGYGKSELARHVATLDERFSTKIQLVLAPDGSGVFDNLVDTQIGIAPILQNEDLLKRKKDLLKKADPETIIVIDNFNNYENEAFLKQLSDSTGDAAILVTSQLVPSALENIFLAKEIDGEVIDVEDENKYPNAFFAQRVFCKYAGFSYDELSSTKKEIVTGICEQIANHTMIAAALGRRAFEYGDALEDLLEALHASVRNCLSEELSIQIPKDRSYNVKHRTPYEILKMLFAGNVLTYTFSERERQVLGAIILLPVEYHTRNVLEELVGDLSAAKAHQAKSATRTLIDANILSTVGPANTPEEKLQMHPLYIQLLSDPNILFHNKTGEELKGPIAELSIEFRQHLMRNASVSMESDPKRSAFNKMQSLISILLCKDGKSFFDGITDTGWLALHQRNWLDDYTPEQASLIQTYINENHRNLGDGRIIGDTEIKDIFITGSATGQLYPPHPSLIFAVGHEMGLSFWIFDTVRKKEWCIVNLQNQLSKENRYYESGKQYTHTRSSCGQASLVCFFMDHSPEALIVPQRINTAVVSSIAALGSGNMSGEIICIPPTVDAIDWRAFAHSPILSRVVILGDSCSIAPSAFFNCECLEYVLFPKCDVSIGDAAFEWCGKLCEVFLPHTAVVSPVFISIETMEPYWTADATIGKDILPSGELGLWMPTQAYLEGQPHIAPPCIAYLPFPKECRIYGLHTSGNEDIIRKEAAAMLAHIRWCMQRIRERVSERKFAIAKEYLNVISLVLAYREQYFAAEQKARIEMATKEVYQQLKPFLS